MEISKPLLTKVLKRFTANQQAIARIKQQITSIENENKTLAQLISQVPDDAGKQFASLQARKAVEKRNSLIKY